MLDKELFYISKMQTKGNEEATVQTLLHMQDIKDAVVMFDALNCQWKTLQQIIKYIVQVNGNQPLLRQVMEMPF